jgi:hypothetical protein
MTCRDVGTCSILSVFTVGTVLAYLRCVEACIYPENRDVGKIDT